MSNGPLLASSTATCWPRGTNASQMHISLQEAREEPFSKQEVLERVCVCQKVTFQDQDVTHPSTFHS